MNDLHVDQLIFDEENKIAYYGTYCNKFELGSYDTGEHYSILGVFANLRFVKYNYGMLLNIMTNNESVKLK